RTVNVVLAAVVAATNAAFGENAKLERGVAMATAQMQDADAALEIAEHDEVLAKGPRAQRNITQLADVADRMPEAVLVFAARRPPANFRESEIGYIRLLAIVAVVSHRKGLLVR